MITRMNMIEKHCTECACGFKALLIKGMIECPQCGIDLIDRHGIATLSDSKLTDLEFSEVESDNLDYVGTLDMDID